MPDEFILTKSHSAFSAGTVVIKVRDNNEGATLVRTKSPTRVNDSEADIRTFWVPTNLLARRRNRHDGV